MIKTEQEYSRSKEYVDKLLRATEQSRAVYAKEGFTDVETKTLLDPQICWRMNIEDEIRVYEDAKAGRLIRPASDSNLGCYLINLRISKSMSQRDLAKALGCDEAWVSSRENNEYFGAGRGEQNKVLIALGSSAIPGI
jgi:hypothetical protein